jgi:ADP-ribose pyrophosphatase
MDLTEKTIRKAIMYRGRILNVRCDDVLLPNGHTSVREVVDHHGGVCILAVRDDGKILFVRQFRYAYGEPVLELPAGKLEAGEDPFSAGCRELREETGMTASVYYDLGEDYPSPGYTNEIIHLYAAEGLSEVGQDLDDDEFLNVEAYTLDEALDMVYDGTLKDSKTQIALLKYSDMKDRGLLCPMSKENAE